MKSNPISVTDPVACRAIARHPNFTSQQLFKAQPAGHKYAPGETRTLIGLQDFPEYNGETVEILSIRRNGDHGKAYYIKGRINEVINWVYEYRLE